jgi:uncharacterized membrane protein YhiD involved in acid resistance
MRPDREANLIRKTSRVGRWSQPPGRGIWRQACVGIVFAAACSSIAQDAHPASPASAVSATSPGSPVGKVSSQSDLKQSKQQAALAAEEQRKKQISAESTQLLAMAEALKAEVDKTNKDVLSINVIRKADEIERLAHNVKERIKQTTGPS